MRRARRLCVRYPKSRYTLPSSARMSGVTEKSFHPQFTDFQLHDFSIISRLSCSTFHCLLQVKVWEWDFMQCSCTMKSSYISSSCMITNLVIHELVPTTSLHACRKPHSSKSRECLKFIAEHWNMHEWLIGTKVCLAQFMTACSVPSCCHCVLAVWTGSQIYMYCTFYFHTRQGANILLFLLLCNYRIIFTFREWILQDFLSIL